MSIYNTTIKESIQDNFRPTWLYIKQHNVTGLKYFGKTFRDPLKYNGSGKNWTTHLQIHGKNVTTIWCQLFHTREEVYNYATQFSIENLIVESDQWANLIIETGLAGVPTGKQGKPKRIMSEEHRAKISKALTGKTRTKEHSAALSAACVGRVPHNKGGSSPLKGIPKSELTKQRMSLARLRYWENQNK